MAGRVDCRSYVPEKYVVTNGFFRDTSKPIITRPTFYNDNADPNIQPTNSAYRIKGNWIIIPGNMKPSWDQNVTVEELLVSDDVVGLGEGNTDLYRLNIWKNKTEKGVTIEDIHTSFPVRADTSMQETLAEDYKHNNVVFDQSTIDTHISEFIKNIPEISIGHAHLDIASFMILSREGFIFNPMFFSGSPFKKTNSEWTGRWPLVYRIVDDTIELMVGGRNLSEERSIAPSQFQYNPNDKYFILSVRLATQNYAELYGRLTDIVSSETITASQLRSVVDPKVRIDRINYRG